MSEETPYVYLSIALDQSACKATLTEALRSRVVELRRRGVSKSTLAQSLETMIGQADETGAEVIVDVIEMLYGVAGDANID